MAVFPSAPRAHSRPGGRLPWHLVVIAVVAAAVSISGPALLHPPDRNLGSAKLTAETSSIAVERSMSPPPGEDAGSGSTWTLSGMEDPLAGVTTPYVLVPSEAAIDQVSLALSADEGVATELVVEFSASHPVSVDSGPAATVGDAQTDLDAQVPDLLAAPARAIELWAAAGVLIETDGQLLDGYSLANIDAALNTLPAGVLGSLGNPAFGPLHILVNAEGRTLSGDQPYRGPANFFSTNEGTNELVLYPQQSVFTIVHELGHAYNLRNVGAGRYAMVLLDSEMRSFLAAVDWEVTSTDAEIRGAVDHMHVQYTYNGAFHWPRVSHDDPLEDFANSFAMYFLDPQTLQQASPERYYWMAETFGR